MKKIITFEITDKTTTVIAGSGHISKTDITGTEIEKDFVALLKKIKEYQTSKQIEDAIDITKWQEV